MKPGNKVLAILNHNISVVKIDDISYVLKKSLPYEQALHSCFPDIKSHDIYSKGLSFQGSIIQWSW